MGILTRLRDIANLPTLPEIIAKLRVAISDGERGASEVANIVMQDPALSSMVLRVANSALYAGASSVRRIQDIRTAIMRIGFSEVMKISAVVCAIRQFPNTNSLIGYRSFWRHSLTAAGVAALVAEKVNCSSSVPSVSKEDIFMAGLFHDIGILIYDQFFHEEFAKIVDLALAKSITFLEAEETLAPRETHGMLGAALLETWRIPLNVIDPIRFHHSPLRAPQNHVIPVTIMALTEHLLANAGVSSFEGNPGRINPQYWEILGISSKQEESLTLLAKLEADKSDVVMFFDKSPGLASSGSATLLRTV